VLGGRASWDDLPEALREHGEFLRRFVAEQGVQTNEVRRSWVLLPCLLWAAEHFGAEKLDLIELGASAGLNLVWDRYGYAYARGRWGSDDAPLQLAGLERGEVPAELLAGRPVVRSRVGVDRDPIDVTSDDGARLLRSFVWADQADRLELLDRAVEAVRADPPQLIRGDLVDLLPSLLARRSPGGLTIVFQTAAFGYLSAGQRERVRAALDEAGAAEPLAFVTTGDPRTGRGSWGLRLVVWPGGIREFLGHADYHGAWLDWGRA
jgi:hypothetical protein